MADNNPVLLTITCFFLFSAVLPATQGVEQDPLVTGDTPLDRLLAYAGVGSSDLGDGIGPLLGPGLSPDPAALIDDALAVHAAYASVADDVREVVRTSARLEGVTLPTTPASPPAPLEEEVLRLYANMGLDVTPAQGMALKSDVAGLGSGPSQGLAILLHTLNEALTSDLSTPDPLYGSALRILDALEEAEPLLLGQGVPTAASCSAVFEDPLYLVRLGSDCDDTVNQTARVLSVDPAGDDLYLHNAGGADTMGLTQGNSPVEEFEVILPHGQPLLDVFLENLTNNPLFPVNTTKLISDPELYASNVTNNASVIVQNLTNVPTGLVDWASQTEVHYQINETRLRTAVPVALHVDLGSGRDTYLGQAPFYVQGAASAGSVGILVDKGGDDSYGCLAKCQGYGFGGLGLHLDLAGDDDRIALEAAQGADAGGILYDGGGDDSYLCISSVCQAGVAIPAVPSLVTLLLDRSGDDTYVAHDRAQGLSATLLDLAGNDVYYSTLGSGQGAGAGGSVGLLLDATGNDNYLAPAGSGAQGAGFGPGKGILADLSGNDLYVASFGQGVANGPGGLGVLYDTSGADTHVVDQGQGFAGGMQGDVATTGLLLDTAGDDLYLASGQAQGVSAVASAAQGTPTPVGSLLGMLLDSDGNDTYVAGDGSQGATSGEDPLNIGGVGFLMDVYGTDSYTAGDNSQGSGGNNGGVGLLLDGTQNSLRASTIVDVGEGEVSVTYEIESPPGGPPTSDNYTAGDHSQGSSGSGGGLGLLWDRENHGGMAITFTAGNHSQGSAIADGTGLLISDIGRASYSAGGHSQGSSLGGLGLLLDRDKSDIYGSSDPATSQGYGDSTTFSDANVTARSALGILLDNAGGHDRYDTPLGNDDCLGRGDIGLAIDTQGLALPPGCGGHLLSGIDAFVAGFVPELLVFLEETRAHTLETVNQTINETIELVNKTLFGAPPTVPANPYFFDDFESGASGWSTSSNSLLTTEWVLADDLTHPQANPGSYSPTHYWYVGTPTGNSYDLLADATLTSPVIDLSAAAAPEFHGWFAGGSEAGYDTLTVSAYEVGNPSNVEVLMTLSGNPIVATYEEVTGNLTAFAGMQIQLEFHFVSDDVVEEGQGWNVDNVAVVEA